MKYKVEYTVSTLYQAEIEIPDEIHHTKWADYVRFHLDSVVNEQPVEGAASVEVHSQWIEPIEGTT